MNENRTIELALLEGMDEHLLTRLHQAGITSRQDLAKALESRKARAQLSTDTGISQERIDALHHLNFLLPEVRAGRFLALERQVENDAQAIGLQLRRSRQLIWTLGILAAIGLVVGLASLFRPGENPRLENEVSALRAELEDQKTVVAGLAPLARGQIENDLASALQQVGPAPSWYGPMTWGQERTNMSSLLGDSPEGQRLHAIHLALVKLVSLEQTQTGTSVLARAQSAAQASAVFPRPKTVQDLWDMAAVLLKLRFSSRALGDAPVQEVRLDHLNLAPWSWTAPGFLECEALLTRLESLPVQEDLLPLWVETMTPLRRSANVARDQLGDRPEAWAREYWILRAEMEFAVTAAFLGKSTLSPYDPQTPLAFLGDRRSYLNRGISVAPGSAKEPLSWLGLEYAEALSLVGWLQENSGHRSKLEGKSWVAALDALEPLRPDPDEADAARIIARINRCLAYGGVTETEPATHSRTRWEAGLRPLLMTTRDLGERPPGSAPGF